MTIFLIMLCNDKHVLGPWVNRTWLNVLASIIVGVLFVLSGILVVTTAVPSVNVLILALVLGALLLAGLVLLATRTFLARRREAARGGSRLRRARELDDASARSSGEAGLVARATAGDAPDVALSF